MRILALLLLLFTSAACEASPGYWLAQRFSSALAQVEQRLANIEDEVHALPVMPDLDALGSHGFHSNFSAASEEHWFELAWDQPQRLDALALIPTRLTTQSGTRSNYGLPKRLRIEATRAGESGRFVLAEIADTRLELRRGDPLFVTFLQTQITSLRFIPLDLPTLPGKGVRFFSLAEVLAFSGEENLAPAARLTANFSIDTEVGWNIHYLVDEQSPLGPPEMPEPGESLGWHGDVPAESGSPLWATIDLRTVETFEAIRLIAARGDAPIKGPGFGFPVRFRLETSSDGGAWKTLWENAERGFPNPGYNPVTLRFPPASGRYVRLMVTGMDAPDFFTTPRVLLSEMEVLHAGHNLARGQRVETPDRREIIPHDATRVWSRASLTDGFSSTGRLMPGRAWVAQLARRFELFCEREDLLARRAAILARWQQLFYTTSFLLLGGAVLALLGWQVRLRLANRRAVAALRQRISSDLHDEVGSSLATIALLSELPPAPQHLDDISRLSRETSQSLHEIVDLTLAPQRARKPLLERLREICTLMLKDHRWSLECATPFELGPEERRTLIFFFKEALHNLLRHAHAQAVEITLGLERGAARLSIADDGQGLPAATTRLRTLQQRAESLSGTLEVVSAPRAGTRLTLRFPLPTLP